MHILRYLLLMVQVGWFADGKSFETKTAAVGENVTLSCQRDASGDVASLFWIRLVVGNMPEILGKTFSFNYDKANLKSHITTKQEPGRFILHIARTKLSDTAFYYCLKSNRYNLTFLRGTFLRIKGSEPDFTAVIQDSLSDTVHAGETVALQCSVFSNSENKMCPEERTVFWLRVASDESLPILIFAQRNSDDKCEKNPETQPRQKCVYDFFRSNISLSDTGTYYCALAACGKFVLGNGTELKIEGDSETNNIFLIVVCVTWALTATALLVCAIRKKSCEFCKDYFCIVFSQKNEDSVVYSTAIFNRRKANKAGRRNATAKGETIYTDVRACLKD
uniref:Ig-like domain-containing protein n=1 Tax=Kryptolebias marmoratus TaxID=37003 RepID=A0A3Q3FQU4_KRYMA